MTKRDEVIESIKTGMELIIAKKNELENNLLKLQKQVKSLEKDAPDPEKIQDLLTFRDVL